MPTRPDSKADSQPEARLAERVRSALIAAALTAFEDARVQGLCCEGAWEAAVSAMRSLDLSASAG